MDRVKFKNYNKKRIYGMRCSTTENDLDWLNF